MVSFSNQADNVEETASGSIPTITDEPSQYTKDARHLFRLARQNAWDELLRKLQDSSSDVIRNAVDESVNSIDEEVSSLLHVVVTCAKVPVSVVQTILDLTSSSSSSSGEDDPSMATIRNHVQQTPVHTTVHFVPERADIVGCLVQAAPETVRFRDALHLRPIDVLCQKIIMMEEVIKYSDHPHEERNILDQLWETVHILARCSCDNNNHGNADLHQQQRQRQQQQQIPEDQRQQPIVHACLLSLDFPFALTERATKRYIKQLRQFNLDGDLPLHVIAKVPPPPKVEGEEDEDDDEGDFLDRVVSLYPAAAAQWNREGQIPLVLAVQSGRRWHSGIVRLLEVHPAGIDDLQLSTHLYPIIFERLLQREQTSTLYGILQAKPELFLPAQNNGSVFPS